MEQMRNEINELIEQSKQKAKVLTEALPYIRRFNNCYVVVKYGGSAMKDKNLQKSVIRDVALLKLVGMKPIIVHGGGKEISKWVAKAGMEPEFVNGLRKTDAETMEIAEMVLGKVGKSLVSMVEKLGVQAVSISGKDGGLLKVEKKYSQGQDIGFVGDVKSVDPKILFDLLEKDFLPIVCQIRLQSLYFHNRYCVHQQQRSPVYRYPAAFRGKTTHTADPEYNVVSSETPRFPVNKTESPAVPFFAFYV